MDMRTIRSIKKISQTDLAKAIGTNQTVISNIETGRMIPTSDEKERIDEALNYPIDWKETILKGLSK